VRAPAAHEQSDDLQRRHGQEEQHADVEVGHAEAGRERDGREDQHARDQEDQRRQVVDPAVGLVGDDVLLHHQLERIRDRLQPAVRPADVVRADARLHAGGELALEQRDVGDEADHHVQDDERGDGVVEDWRH
jgi:hypothetical protein